MTNDLKRLGKLLRNRKRLKIHEEADLLSWLMQIQLDCAMIGATEDDANLMRAIRKRCGVRPVIHTPIEPSGKSR